MSKSTYPLKLPLSTKKAAQRLAKEDGVAFNQWIASAVAEKVGVVETAADFFKRRARRGQLAKDYRNIFTKSPERRPNLKTQSGKGKRRLLVFCGF